MAPLSAATTSMVVERRTFMNAVPFHTSWALALPAGKARAHLLWSHNPSFNASPLSVRSLCQCVPGTGRRLFGHQGGACAACDGPSANRLLARMAGRHGPRSPVVSPSRLHHLALSSFFSPSSSRRTRLSLSALHLRPPPARLSKGRRPQFGTGAFSRFWCFWPMVTPRTRLSAYLSCLSLDLSFGT